MRTLGDYSGDLIRFRWGVCKNLLNTTKPMIHMPLYGDRIAAIGLISGALQGNNWRLISAGINISLKRIKLITLQLITFASTKM
jgi:hypothetical protein